MLPGSHADRRETSIGETEGTPKLPASVPSNVDLDETQGRETTLEAPGMNIYLGHRQQHLWEISPADQCRR